MFLKHNEQEMIKDISYNVLKSVSPLESQYADMFVSTYFSQSKGLIESAEERKISEEDDLLSFGTPELISTLVIPIVVEIVIKFIIPAIKEKVDENTRKKEIIDLRIVLDKKRGDFELKLQGNCKDKKLRKKIIDEVIKEAAIYLNSIN